MAVEKADVDEYELAMSSTHEDYIEYVDEREKDYDCGICLHKVRNCVAVCEDHIFCEDCIAALIADNDTRGTVPRCPMCRSRISRNEVKRVKFIDRQIRDLLIKCPNHQITPSRSIYLSHKDQKQHHKTSKKRVKRERTERSSCRKSTSLSRCSSRSRSRSRDRRRNKPRSDIKQERPQQEDEREDEELTTESEREEAHEQQHVHALCEWTGKLSSLHVHIAQCKYEIVRCKECDQYIERGEKEQHEKVCPNLPVACDLCLDEIPRSFLADHKLKECQYAKVHCKACQTEMERRELEAHCMQCPEEMVHCDFAKYGCPEIKRKNLRLHLQTNTERHLKLVKDSHAKLEESFADYQSMTDQRFQELEDLVYSALPTMPQIPESAVFRQEDQVSFYHVQQPSLSFGEWSYHIV